MQNTWMMEIKLSAFIDDVIVSAENHEEYTKMLTELVREFSNVSGYRIIRN